MYLKIVSYSVDYAAYITVEHAIMIYGKPPHQK